MLESLAYVTLALVAAGTLLFEVRKGGHRLMGVVVCVLLIGALAAAKLTPHTPVAGGDDDPANDQRPLKSHDQGYVSSDACAACHPDQYATWHRSYHRTMTQVITPETMLAEWTGAFRLDGKTYQLAQLDDRYWVMITDPETGQRGRIRVLMATGSHHQQVYWVAGGVGRELQLLPFTWLVEEKRWIPYRFSFLEPDDPTHTPIAWNGRCIFCHSTGGQPRIEDTPAGVDTTVGELGIGCEACHGPGDAHVRANRSTWHRYRSYLTGRDDETIVNPEKIPVDRANEICGHCHSMTAFADGQYADIAMTVGSTFRPGDDLSETRRRMARPASGEVSDWPDFVEFDEFTWADGQIRNSGRDYNGVVESPCAVGGELSCLSCHSMHHSDPEDQLAEGMDGDRACLQCHEDLGLDTEAHTHHEAESSGSRCYNCHMPHTTYGLLKAIRSHTIGKSPSVRESLEIGRPNACNLCHLDKSLAWTGRYLEEWYGQPLVPLPGPEEEQRSAAVLWLLRGDALQRALAAWHMGWEPAVEASGSEWIAPTLAYALADPYSAVRFIGERSLKRLPGFEEFDYRYAAPPAAREQARIRAQQLWQLQHQGERLARNPEVFLGSDGRLEMQLLQDVVRRRDNSYVKIAE